jgi:peptidoglycan hydrolase-like protein with peptidoglycan-binding domain
MKLRIAIAAFALSSLGAIASPVSDAQRALNDKGFNVGPADGQMGARTKAALKQFQQMQGLPASGQLDAQTLAALNVGSASPAQSMQQQQPPSEATPQTEPAPQGSGFSPQRPSEPS